MIEPIEIDRREAIKRIFAIGATFSLGGLLVRQARVDHLWDYHAAPLASTITRIGEFEIDITTGRQGAFIAWADEELERTARRLTAQIAEFYSPDPRVVEALFRRATDVTIAR